jgi:hypothetical protein
VSDTIAKVRIQLGEIALDILRRMVDGECPFSVVAENGDAMAVVPADLLRQAKAVVEKAAEPAKCRGCFAVLPIPPAEHICPLAGGQSAMWGAEEVC